MEPMSWTQQSYSMSKLRDRASDWRAACQSLPTHMASLNESSFSFQDCGLPGANVTTLYQYWTSSQSWIRYPGLPIRLSYILLYLDNTSSLTPDWYIVQYYTSESEPCSRRRFMIKMNNPVTVAPYGSHGLPIMSPSFNHLCWMEVVDGRRGGRKVKKRVLRLVTFPEPGDAPLDSSTLVRTLKVPRKILDNVCHVFVQPGTGAILLTTSKNELHRFQYA